MSNKNSKSFYLKLFLIVAAVWSLIGCYSIQPTTTVVQDSRGNTLSSNTIYTVKNEDNEIASFNTLQEAQYKVLGLNNSQWTAAGNTQFDRNYWFWQWSQITPLPVNTVYKKTPEPTKTSTNNGNKTTSVTQDITSTGNSATPTPLPMSACYMMVNMQCNPNTVTAVTAVVATAVIGGITAGVISSVNSSAQKAQQEQKNKDLWSIVATTAKGAAQGAASGPSCQCNSAIQASPPYCTGAGICQCGAPNCPP